MRIRVGWLLVLYAALPISASAESKKTISGFALPHRAASIDGMIGEVVQRMALRSGARVVTRARKAAALAARVQEGRRLESAGDVAEAAATYDVAVAAGRRALASDPAIITALVARANLGLALKEEQASRALLGEAMAYWPGFVLRPDEARPSLSRLVEEVRGAKGRRDIPLERVCRAAPTDVVVVARALSGTQVEFSAIESCRVRASVVVSRGTRIDRVVAALDRDTKVVTGGRKREDGSSRRYLWWGAGAVAAGLVVTAAILLPGQLGDDDPEVRVIPHW